MDARWGDENRADWPKPPLADAITVTGVRHAAHGGSALSVSVPRNRSLDPPVGYALCRLSRLISLITAARILPTVGVQPP